jgi:hypothetical protein
MKRAADFFLQDFRPEMDGTALFDIGMRCDHRPIGGCAIFEDLPIQLTHSPDMKGHAEIAFAEILMIEKINFR